MLLELNKFYIAEAVSFMKNNVPDNFVDLTITSPPYDNLRIYKGFAFDYKSMLEELYRVIKPGE
jgi:site-specific DNA-methyltransferase (adenine-specific)